ncbi:MAG: hypothetical protein JSR77_10690 [Planctomycetes bacterium]|nr:hypothetical protein [Planctomycetota bacterium]
MRTSRFVRRSLSGLLIAAAMTAASAQSFTTGFTYQGRLDEAGVPAASSYDMRFRLYTLSVGGVQVGSTLSALNITPENGCFAVKLDFGTGAYTGQTRWLEIDVAYAGSSGYTTLTPRRELTAAPHASFSLNALSAATANNALALNGQAASYYLNAGNLSSGSVPAARLTGTYSFPLTFSNASNVFSGSGAGLINLNATNLATGTLADARLSSNVALLNTYQTFTATKIFNAPIGINISPYDSALQIRSEDYYTLTSNNTRSDYGIAIRGIQRGGADSYPGYGAGVFGTSDTGSGVAGSSDSGYGVWGVCANPSSSGDGVYGLAHGSGRGVYGFAYSSTAVSRGVRGDANSTSGIGVEGVAYATTGGTVGVRGETVSSSGVGVLGVANAASGGIYGVKGTVASGGWLPAGVYGYSEWQTTTGGASVVGSRSVDLSTHSMPVYGGAVAGFSQVGPAVVGWCDGLSTYANPFGVWGRSANTTLSDAAGVLGEADGSTATGVRGWANSTSGLNYGGRFGTNSAGGYGVLGETAGNSTSIIGVSGVSGKGGTGVRAESTVRGGNGVIAIANGTSAYAVYGESDIGYAGYFNGNVYVSRSFTVAGTKSFMIDHPLDPANKYLLHSCVESDQMLNIYRGNAMLDSSGEAVVTLPAWFEAANRDFSYQLTPIGAAAPLLHVAGEIESNSFRIAGGPAGLKVSWTVTALRDDAYARTNPMQAEQIKPAHERGTYLHPELFGKPEMLNVVSAKNSLPVQVNQTVTPPRTQTISPADR